MTAIYRLECWLQERRLDGLMRRQDAELAEAEAAQKRANGIGFDIVAASIALSQLRGELPSGRKVIATTTKSAWLSWPSIFQTVVMLCVCTLLYVVWVVAKDALFAPY